MKIGTKVRVIKSPYYTLRQGSTGKIVEDGWEGKLFLVRFEGAVDWHLRPYELEVLDES